MRDAEHILFTRLNRRPQSGKTRPRVDTRTLGGRVIEVSPDREFVRVGLTPDAEDVGPWVRSDGVTAIGAAATFAVGTDGRPISSLQTGTIPPGATLEHVGPTGKRILDQQLIIDQTVQEIDGVRDRLDDMDGAVAAASTMYVTSDRPPGLGDVEGRNLGTIWQRRGTAADGNSIITGRWILTSAGWETFADGGSVVHGETVAAAVGVFIDSMVQHLTVTGAANISEAAIGKLTARIADIIRINVEQLYIGRDIRFTSSGLVFYAPPAEGQDPEDWDHRSPLIAITPTGDTSISVAKGGAITAGITAQGAVWGREGNFDRVTVGGEDLLDKINNGPRGALSFLRLTGTAVPVNTSGNLKFGLRAPLRKGRMYRVTQQFSHYAASGNKPLTVGLYVVYNGWSTQTSVAQYANWFDSTFFKQYVFNADEIAFADGESVGFYTTATVAAGAGEIHPGGFMLIEDIGPSLPILTHSGPAAPPTSPVNYYTDTFWSTGAYGIRPNGTGAVDGRFTMGGYSRFGTDMAQFIWYPINFAPLYGSTVVAATATLTFTSSLGPSQVSYWLDVANGAGGGAIPGRANIAQGWGAVGGSHNRPIPAATMQRLVGAGGLLVAPYTPGSDQSYAHMSSSALIRISYKK